MTCRRVQDLASAYIEGEATAEERSAVEAHLPVCHACTVAMHDARRMLSLLHGLPRVEPSAEFTGDVMRRVQEIADAEGEAAAGWRRFLPAIRLPEFEWPRWAWAPVAMAAGVLLTLGGIRVGVVPVAGLQPHAPAVASAPAVNAPARSASVTPAAPEAPRTYATAAPRRRAPRSAQQSVTPAADDVATRNPLRDSQVTGGAAFELTGHDLLDPAYGAQVDFVLDRVSLDGRPLSAAGTVQPVQEQRRAERRLRTF